MYVDLVVNIFFSIYNPLPMIIIDKDRAYSFWHCRSIEIHPAHLLLSVTTEVTLQSQVLVEQSVRNRS